MEKESGTIFSLIDNIDIENHSQTTRKLRINALRPCHMYSVMIMYDMGAEYRLPYDYDAGKYDHLYPFVFDSLSFCLEGVKTGGMGFKTLRI